MRTFKLTIEYDGTDFKGWQVQTSRQRTVQGEIEKALKKIFGKPARLTGSGRTDTGVHARGQVAHFKASTQMDVEEVLRALNGNLPQDITVLAAQEVPADFHARYDVKRKTYQYFILNRAVRPCLDRRTCWHIPQKLNLTKMREEAQALVGTHDFRSFMAADPAERSGHKNTVRRIKQLEITRKKDLITVKIEANGFLYKMVRNIVGTLVAAGRGQLPKGQIKEILRKKDRNLAAATAPAQGLFLWEVNY